MVPILLVMLSGIITGFFMNRFPRLIKVNDKLTSWTIYILLFLLGISVGLNKTIFRNLDQIGFQSVIITLGAISGSIIALWFVYRYFFKSDETNPSHEE